MQAVHDFGQVSQSDQGSITSAAKIGFGCARMEEEGLRLAVLGPWNYARPRFGSSCTLNHGNRCCLNRKPQVC
jgi:hypothetical protein